MRTLISTLIFFILFSINSNAQTWTLQQCINYAIENNIQIKRQKLNSEYAENNYFQSRLNVLPGVNAGANQNFNFGRSVDPFTNDFITQNTSSNDFYISARVNLFNGFQNYNNIQKRRFELQQSEYSLDKTKNDITLEIAIAYLQVLFNFEALEASENQLNVTKLQVEKSSKLVEVGNVAKGELLEIQAQMANEELSVLVNKNALQDSYLTLTQLLDLDSVGNFEVTVPENIEFTMDFPLQSIEELYHQSLTSMPEIKRDEYYLRSQEKNLDVVKGQRYPTLSLRGSYYSGYSDARQQVEDIIQENQITGYVGGDENQPVTLPGYRFVYGDYSFSDQFKDNAYKSLSFSLSIPIFNQYQVKTGIDNSKLAVLDAKYQLDLTKKNLYKTIQQSHADALAALEKFKSTEKAVASYQEAFVYAEQKYNVGLLSSVDYNLAKNNLTKSKSDLLQAKYEYIFKTRILDFYTGKQIIL